MSYPPELENAILRRLLSQTTEAYEEQLSELHAEKEFHQITLESIVDGVITTNHEGQVHSLNPVAEQLTGWELRSARGKLLSEVFRLVDIEGAPVEIRLDDDRAKQKTEAILVRPDDRKFSVEFSSSPLHDRLSNLIGGVIVFQDVTERRLMQLQLSHEATHDSLTGVLNRRAFDQRLRAALGEVTRTGASQGLCYLDLDRFKLVNDTCGHFAGDELLRQVTALIQEKIAHSGVLARLGGDEFAILVPDAGREAIISIAEDVFSAIRNYRFSWGERSFDITASVGVVPITSRFETVDQVMSAADHCCYLSKERGRNRLQVFDPDDEGLRKLHHQLDWVARIETILQEDSLSLHGQEIHPLSIDSSIHFFEVFIRVDDGHGTFLPGEVINAAESYGLMPKVDRWVVGQTMKTLGEAAMKHDFLCSINLSALSLSDPDLVGYIEQSLHENRVSAESVCFEISESATIANISEARRLVERLRSRGCRFAVDDFGAGMSSLAHLREVRFDFVKIHQTFINDIVNDPQDYAMVEAIHQLAHILGMKTIAESVSKADVVQALERIGVDYGQGFSLSQPRELSDIVNGR